MSTWIKRVVLRDRVVGRRDLAVLRTPTASTRSTSLNARFGGAGALLAVSPADGQRVMRSGMHPLPLTEVATGAWSISATAASDGPASTQPSPARSRRGGRRSARWPRTLRIDRLVEGDRTGGRHRLVEVPDLGIKRKRDHDGRRARARRLRATRKAWKIAPGISAWWRTSIQSFHDRAEDRGVGERRGPGRSGRWASG